MPKVVILGLVEKLWKNGPSPLFIPTIISVAIMASHASPKPMIAPVTSPDTDAGKVKYFMRFQPVRPYISTAS